MLNVKTSVVVEENLLLGEERGCKEREHEGKFVVGKIERIYIYRERESERRSDTRRPCFLLLI